MWAEGESFYAAQPRESVLSRGHPGPAVPNLSPRKGERLYCVRYIPYLLVPCFPEFARQVDELPSLRGVLSRKVLCRSQGGRKVAELIGGGVAGAVHHQSCARLRPVTGYRALVAAPSIRRISSLCSAGMAARWSPQM